MAEFDTRVRFDQVSAGELQVKHTIVDTSKGRQDYVVVSNISKAKTGKHGAAKVMVTGRSVRSGKKWENTYTGGTVVSITNIVKKQYVLEDIFEASEEFYMRPHDNSGNECDVYSFQGIDQEEITKLTEIFEKGYRKALIVTVMSAPEFIRFDDIKEMGENK